MLQANAEMQRVTQWFLDNNLLVNRTKTKYMIFDLKKIHKYKHILRNFDLKVDN